MAIDNFFNQLRMLREVKQTLNSLKNYMSTMEEKYKKQIDSAENGLFLEDFTNPLRERHKIFSNKTNNILIQIEKIKKIISKHEEYIQRMIQIAKNNQ